MEKKQGSPIVGVIIVLFIIILFVTMCGGSGSGGSSSSSSRTCKSCGRTFTDSSNKNSIARTGMCTNCYNNYKWWHGSNDPHEEAEDIMCLERIGERSYAVPMAARIPLDLLNGK